MHRKEYTGALVFANRFLRDLDVLKLSTKGYDHSYKTITNVLKQMKSEVKDEHKIKK